MNTIHVFAQTTTVDIQAAGVLDFFDNLFTRGTATAIGGAVFLAVVLAIVAFLKGGPIPGIIAVILAAFFLYFVSNLGEAPGAIDTTITDLNTPAGA